jgi:rod shape-determining protein MreB and related proteins
MLDLWKNKLYVRIHPDSLMVRDVKSGEVVKERPLVAFSEGKKKEVLAIGEAAAALTGGAGVAVVNPFKHPRTPLSDFAVAETLLKGFVRKVYGNTLFATSPTIVIQLALELEGGITPIEARVLRELALGAGAAKVIAWEGPELSDEQVRNLDFPATGRVVS